MYISINGKEKNINDNLRLNQLIEQLELNGKRLAVEVNQEIIPKSEHANYRIKDGDNIEIVHAIGGGDPSAKYQKKVFASHFKLPTRQRKHHEK